MRCTAAKPFLDFFQMPTVLLKKIGRFAADFLTFLRTLGWVSISHALSELFSWTSSLFRWNHHYPAGLQKGKLCHKIRYRKPISISSARARPPPHREGCDGYMQISLVQPKAPNQFLWPPKNQQCYQVCNHQGQHVAQLLELVFWPKNGNWTTKLVFDNFRTKTKVRDHRTNFDLVGLRRR